MLQLSAEEAFDSESLRVCIFRTMKIVSVICVRTSFDRTVSGM